MAAAMFSIPLSTLLAAHLYKMHFFVKLFHNTTFTSIATSASLKAEPTLNPSVQSYGAIPFNFIAFASLLQDCTDMKTLSGGRQVHAHMLISGHGKNIFLDTKLVNMYATCGSLVDARRIFDKTSTKDVFIWNTMIRGYARNGLYEETLTLYYKMLQIGLKPDSFTFSCVLKACTFLSDVDHGEEIHYYIIGSGYESDVFVGSALVDMYAKCGKIEKSRYVFDKIAQRSVVSWNSMIAGCVQNGHFQEALKLLCQMQVTSAKLKPDTVTIASVLPACVKPDSVTIASVLPACACLEVLQQGKEIHDYTIRSGLEHAGLVDQGRQCFNCMTQDHCITPGMEHYACMVDLLGRAGQLDEAHDFIERMPLKPDAAVCGSFLAACRLHCNIELGECVAKRLFELETENVGYYVLLSNIYASAARWDDVAKVRKKMKQRGLKKFPGCSWIEVKNKVHVFFGGGRSHPQSGHMYELVESFAEQMQEAGYVPDTTFVLHDGE
eukprot:Gb_07636 [translate_table: standard]